MHQPDGDPGSRTAIVVSGMHRSGTSAMTRVVSLLGAGLPEDLIEGRSDNERGFWEGREVVELDEDVLRTSGTWWGGWQSIDAERLLARPRPLERARTLVREGFEGEALLVLKDPRVSRILPLWTRALDEEGCDAVHVVAVRHPAAVAASVHRRNGLSPRAAALSWLAHMLDAELFTRGRPRVFVSFERFLQDWTAEVARIGSALRLGWPRAVDEVAPEVDQFIEPSLVHQEATGELPGAVRTVAPVTDVFTRWAADDVRAGDEDLLDRWRAELAPVRRPASAVARVSEMRRREIVRREGKGQELGVMAKRQFWSPMMHEGYNVEADAAWEWLARERQHQAPLAAADPADAAGSGGKVGRALRRITPGGSAS